MFFLWGICGDFQQVLFKDIGTSTNFNDNYLLRPVASGISMTREDDCTIVTFPNWSTITQCFPLSDDSYYWSIPTDGSVVFEFDLILNNNVYIQGGAYPDKNTLKPLSRVITDPCHIKIIVSSDTIQIYTDNTLYATKKDFTDAIYARLSFENSTIASIKFKNLIVYNE